MATGLANRLKNFVANTLFETIKKGGKLVPVQQAEARIEVCRGCSLSGMVEPLPGLVVEGCTECGCPFATKPYMFNYLSPSQGKIVLIECPHPEGNKWEVIDQQFKS